MIIMDQRGLGHSEPILACPEVRPVAGVAIGTALMKTMFLDAMQACHDRLTAQGIDVGSYNLTEIAADAEDLRITLGVDQWNLITLGMASSISFEIIRRYPEHVRVVVFDSPDAPQVDLLTEAVASTKYAVREVADACAEDPRCDRTFPDLLSTWNQALRRLHAHPSRLTDRGNGLSIEPGVWVVIDAASAVRGMRNAFIWNAATFPRDVYSIHDYGYVINREPGRELDASWDPPFFQGYMPYYDSHRLGIFARSERSGPSTQSCVTTRCRSWTGRPSPRPPRASHGTSRPTARARTSRVACGGTRGARMPTPTTLWSLTSPRCCCTGGSIRTRPSR